MIARKQSMAIIVAGSCSLSMGAQPEITYTVQQLPDAPSNQQVFLTGVTSAQGEAWSVGYYRTGSQTRTLTYAWDGASWTMRDSPSPASDVGTVNVTLADVDTLDGSTVYAVGTYLATGSISPDTFLIVWDGSAWTHVVTPGQSTFGAQGFLFESVHVDESATAWMGGQFASLVGWPTATLVALDSGFDRYDGPLISNSAHRIRAIDSSESGEIWAVGSAGGSAVAIGRPYALYNDGSGWHEQSPPITGTGEVLRAVVVVAPDDVWASGAYQVFESPQIVTYPLFWHWDGSSWTRHESPAYAEDLVALSPTDIYGVSGSTLVHWDGVAWSIIADIEGPDAPSANLRSIEILSPNTLLAVGEAPRSTTPIAVEFTIGSACVGDLAEPFGQLDFSDVAAFLTAFGTMDPAADLAEPFGSYDFSDVSAFLVAFASGCP